VGPDFSHGLPGGTAGDGAADPPETGLSHELPDNDTDNDSYRLSLPDINDSRMQVPKNSGLSSQPDSNLSSSGKALHSLTNFP